MAYLAFSGANHTRFEHSVGTMHIAYLIGQSIGLRDSDLQAVRLAALVHDVGHPPYSHSVEFAFRLSNFDQKFSHEEFTYKKVCNNEELANILKREIPLLHQEDIAKLATGKHEDKILSRIINGPLDADKIDYILRDNYHCGFPVALDISAITEIFSANRERGIMLKLAGLSFAEQLFIGRYHLITKIHHDQTNRLVNYLLALAINEALENSNKSNGKNKVVEMMFDTWTDVDLMNFLKEKSETYFPRLNDFMLGKESLKEVANFGYDELSPFARYNAYVLSENLNYLLSVSKKLSNKL
ncbi:MAG: HD domain-containing protein, partial [archaeon]|nr:HD domain-containing protein [archaeon]